MFGTFFKVSGLQYKSCVASRWQHDCVAWLDMMCSKRLLDYRTSTTLRPAGSRERQFCCEAPEAVFVPQVHRRSYIPRGALARTRVKPLSHRCPNYATLRKLFHALHHANESVLISKWLKHWLEITPLEDEISFTAHVMGQLLLHGAAARQSVERSLDDMDARGIHPALGRFIRRLVYVYWDVEMSARKPATTYWVAMTKLAWRVSSEFFFRRDLNLDRSRRTTRSTSAANNAVVTNTTDATAPSMRFKPNGNAAGLRAKVRRSDARSEAASQSDVRGWSEENREGNKPTALSGGPRGADRRVVVRYLSRRQRSQQMLSSRAKSVAAASAVPVPEVRLYRGLTPIVSLSQESSRQLEFCGVADLGLPTHAGGYAQQVETAIAEIEQTWADTLTQHADR